MDNTGGKMQDKTKSKVCSVIGQVQCREPVMSCHTSM